ncbi:hypothetical protein [Embleya sp. MST-111070]
MPYAPEGHHLLVHGRGRSPEAWQAWVAEALVLQLLTGAEDPG